MMNDYFDSLLDAWGIGRKDSSFKKKIKQHQDRHVELLISYQELCQNTFKAMLTSSMKGDLNTMQITHKEFLDGLNKTLESMFTNHIELASQAPEKIGQMLNLHRTNYEKLFDNLPQISQIKNQINQNDKMNSMKKLALGTMSAVLASVTMPTKSLTSLIDQDGDRVEIVAPVVVAQVPLEHRSYPQNDLVGDTHVLCPQGFTLGQTAPSLIYATGGYNYPKMTMLHPYNPTGGEQGERINGGLVSVPLAIFLTPDYHVNLPAVLKNRLAQANISPQRTQIMVNFQNFPWNDGTQISLRPQYATEPNASTQSTQAFPVAVERNITAGVFNSTNNDLFLSDWVVRPGGNPENGDDYIASDKPVNSFNQFTVSTHGDNNVEVSDVVLSGIAPFVKGLSTKGDCFWSYVDYLANDGQNSALVTLQCVLTDAQRDVLEQELQNHLAQDGDSIQNFLNVVNALQRTQAFNDESAHIEKLAELMGFIAPKITFNIQKYDDTPCILDGVSGPEGTLRWSVGPKSTVSVPIYKNAQTVTFNTLAFLPPSHSQRATVTINNHPLNTTFNYDQAHPGHKISSVVRQGSPFANFEFDIPTHVSPGDSDPRELGIAFRGIEESLPYSLSRTTQHFLGQDAAFPFELRTGFSGAEGLRRWTDGGTATIRIPLDADINRRPHAITFLNVSAFTPGQHTQLVNVKLNGVLVSQHIFSEAQNAQTIKVPLPTNLDGDATLEFEMPNVLSPGSNDPRNLGLSLHETVMTYLR